MTEVMKMQWTQKETMLLQDMMNTEQICIEKYTDYADRACDPELKTLFDSIKQVEQGHYDTLSQMSNGTIPQMNQGGQSQSKQGGQQKQTDKAPKNGAEKTAKPQEDATGKCEEDEYLCRDALDTEKHTSSLYDTCIFEFVSEQARDVLNHIQKEEQQHGKQIYDYMTAHGMSA